MPSFSKMGINFNFHVYDGPSAPISVQTLNPPGTTSTIDERRLTIECVFNYDGGYLPGEIGILLFQPSASILNPFLPAAIHPPPMLEEQIRSPVSGVLPRINETQIWAWAIQYWDSVSSNRKTVWFSDTADDVAVWPGDRHEHRMQFPDYQSGDVFPGAGVPLRVATTLNAAAKKLMLLVDIRRKSRRKQKIVLFDVQGSTSLLRQLQLGWIPTAIVYDPPGQDMTNSLIDNTVHGTRMSLAESFVFSNEHSFSTSLDFGLSFLTASAGVNIEESGSISNTTIDGFSSTMEIVGTQETMITANNQRAIGRSFWGPLSDLFVILEGPWIGCDQVFNDRSEEVDGLSAFFAIRPSTISRGTRKLIVPTHLLLFPNGDEIASRIPWSPSSTGGGGRKAILLLNPSITRDEAILDAVNAGTRPVQDAIVRDADPNGVNPGRAVLVASFGLAPGAEVNYYDSVSVKLESTETQSEDYSTVVTDSVGGSAGASVGIGAVAVSESIGIQAGDSVSFKYRSTSEFTKTDVRTYTAKCYLIRNQNDAGVGDIDIFYDTMFGTFMFRRHEHHAGGCVLVEGKVHNIHGKPVLNEKIVVENVKSGTKRASATDAQGQFVLRCVKEGDYVLQVGGVSRDIKVSGERIDSGESKLFVPIEGARKTLNVEKLTLREAADLFAISELEARTLWNDIGKAGRTFDIYKRLGFSADRKKHFDEVYSIVLPDPSKVAQSMRAKSLAAKSKKHK